MKIIARNLVTNEIIHEFKADEELTELAKEMDFKEIILDFIETPE